MYLLVMYIALFEIVHNCIVFNRKAVLLLNVRNKYYIYKCVASLQKGPHVVKMILIEQVMTNLLKIFLAF